MKEREVVAECKKWLEAHGYIVFKYYGSPFSVKGFTDLHGHHKITGKAFYIEVKLPGKDPTLWQAKFIERMRDSGAIAGVARSVDELQKIFYPIF